MISHISHIDHMMSLANTDKYDFRCDFILDYLINSLLYNKKMATIHINCLFVDDYSFENIFKIEIKENETVRNLVEVIKKRNIGFGDYKLKILKIELSLDTLSDKLAFIEFNSFESNSF